MGWKIVNTIESLKQLSMVTACLNSLLILRTSCTYSSFSRDSSLCMYLLYVESVELTGESSKINRPMFTLASLKLVCMSFLNS